MVRIYLTPEEAESGTNRMIRPPGGRWVEMAIPPTRHNAVLHLVSEYGLVRVRVTVVPPGLSGSATGTASGRWRSSLRIVLAVLIGVLCLVAVVVAMRSCTVAGIPASHPPTVGTSQN
jgi:hypothetical protein